MTRSLIDRRWAAPLSAAALLLTLASPAEAGVTDWQRTPTPALDRSYDLRDTVAVAQNDVIAVGNRYSGHPPVVLRWNGQSWQTDTRVPAEQSTLISVTARGPNNVWAVGSTWDADAAAERPTTLKWDGTRWRRFNGIVNDPAESMAFKGAAVVSASTLWAVGDEVGAGYTRRPTAQRRDGQRWQRFVLPFQGTSGTVSSISARSATDIWAVGEERESVFAPRAVAWHWNGSVWSRMLIGDGTEFQPRDVVAVSSTEVWAVGLQPDPAQKPAVARWNGTGWQMVGAPPAPAGASLATLDAVETDGRGGVWAAGMSYSSSTQGFFAQYTNGAWTTAVNPNGLTGLVEGLSRVPGSTTVWAAGRESDASGGCGLCQGLAGVHR
ncbi:hypothetical protein SMC26_16075 [Actinomadura fulvescens]|uniref:Uncharacterized protein n=1 Tax=Actinomadura fulvescens TaxID=46160 RepID=A0ABN3QWH5_9ACTN